MTRIEGKINQTAIVPVPGPGFGLDPSLFLELCCDPRKCFLKACACKKHWLILNMSVMLRGEFGEWPSHGGQSTVICDPSFRGHRSEG
jgi:hypothetical protein